MPIPVRQDSPPIVPVRFAGVTQTALSRNRRQREDATIVEPAIVTSPDFAGNAAIGGNDANGRTSRDRFQSASCSLGKARSARRTLRTISTGPSIRLTFCFRAGSHPAERRLPASREAAAPLFLKGSVCERSRTLGQSSKAGCVELCCFVVSEYFLAFGERKLRGFVA